MPQVALRKHQPAPDDEVIEDSEPEREEVREQEKERRRARRAGRDREHKKGLVANDTVLGRETIRNNVPRRPVCRPPDRSVIEISGVLHLREIEERASEL